MTNLKENPESKSMSKLKFAIDSMKVVSRLRSLLTIIISLAMKLDENIFLWFLHADSEFLCTADSASIITISARLFLLFICSMRMLTAPSIGPQIVFMSDVWHQMRLTWHRWRRRNIISRLLKDRLSKYLSNLLRCLYYQDSKSHPPKDQQAEKLETKTFHHLR